MILVKIGIIEFLYLSYEGSAVDLYNNIGYLILLKYERLQIEETDILTDSVVPVLKKQITCLSVKKYSV